MGKSTSIPPAPGWAAKESGGQAAAYRKRAKMRAGLPAEVRIDTETGATMIVVPSKTCIPRVPRRREEP